MGMAADYTDTRRCLLDLGVAHVRLRNAQPHLTSYALLAIPNPMWHMGRKTPACVDRLQATHDPKPNLCNLCNLWLFLFLRNPVKSA
jgi:hypothetical protein